MAKPPSRKKRILFLLKENMDSGGNITGIAKSGLLNSVRLLARALEFFKIIKEYAIKVCVDANQIDREVTMFRPDVCFIEAIWVTEEKLREIQRLHPKVIFVIRVHSNIPFLAMEGVAFDRLFGYYHIPNVLVSFNNYNTDVYCKTIFNSYYLPNVYFSEDRTPFEKEVFAKQWVDIGCFGSIRPFKNQLLQAVAAVNWGSANNVTIHFHINSARVEQAGDNPLKNLRSLFEHSTHKLIEHPWMSHRDFLKIVSNLDIGLQASLTESFNIVSADFVSENVPIIVSHDISWMPKSLQIEATDAKALEEKIDKVLGNKNRFIREQKRALGEYNAESLKVWKKFLDSNER